MLFLGTLLIFLVLLGGSASAAIGEVIVDDQGSGFTKYGTSSFWKEASIGYNNHMFYTYNSQSPVDNYAMWKPSLSSVGAGTYTVYVYIPSNYADTTNAVYTIYHNGITDTRYVNQASYYDVWVTLGDFYFSASGNEYVKLVDATGESSATKRVGFDAVKWIKKEPILASPPTLVSPGSGSFPGTTISSLTPTFQWNSVTGADSYGLYIRDLDTGSLIFDSQARGISLTGTSYLLPSGILQLGKHYRWDMNSHNSAGW
ncbi:MAG: hypothetical protein WA130_08390, partial [Candidatus Methanoperedens sp.]